MAGWNLARFADALLPLFSDDQEQAIALAEKALGGFPDQYDTAWSMGMQAKLGLPWHLEVEVVKPLVDELLEMLQQDNVDFTSFFRRLGHAARGNAEPARELLVDLTGFDGWLKRWRALDPDAGLMDRSNPMYIPRNHLVEEALTAATAGDLEPLEQLLAAVIDPYDERPGLERYAAAAPEEFGSYRTFCGT